MSPASKTLLSGKTVLVCGGAGFMGSNFIHFLFANISGVKIRNREVLTYAGNRQKLKGLGDKPYTFMQGDIADKSLTERLFRQADYVVNFAAETHVDRSIHKGAADFVHTNIEGVHALLEALRASPNVKKMVQVSTDEVWGDLPLGSKKKFNEETPFKPNSPYAASKAGGDLLIRSYVKTYGLPVIVSHSVNNFGPRQFPEKLIPFFALRAMKGESLPLYGDGKNVRDWLYVDDHSSAIATLLKKGKAGDVYAISCGEEYANIDIAKKILGILGKSEKLITFVKDRPAHDRRYSVDSSKIRALGWRPRISFDEKLKETLQWYSENKSWIKGVIKNNTNINSHISLK